MSKILNIIIIILVETWVVIEAEVKLKAYGSSTDEYDAIPLSSIEDITASSYFDVSRCTFVMIHGFNGSTTGEAVVPMVRGAMAGLRDCNILALDWSKESSSTDLFGADGSYTANVVGVVQAVGNMFGVALNKLANLGLDLSAVKIYGHSLGAHVAGYCGRKLKSFFGKTIGWIMGMDQAGPFYQLPLLLGIPLGKDAASFVGCLHSDPGGKGNNESLCHQDYWVNRLRFFRANKSQRVQPGCPEGVFKQFSDEDLCSHNYCWKVMNSSFINEFLISQGSTYWQWARSDGTASPVTKLNLAVDTTLRGDFYFSALDEYSYTMGEEGLKPYIY